MEDLVGFEGSRQRPVLGISNSVTPLFVRSPNIVSPVGESDGIKCISILRCVQYTGLWLVTILSLLLDILCNIIGSFHTFIKHSCIQVENRSSDLRLDRTLGNMDQLVINGEYIGKFNKALVIIESQRLSHIF